jgi:hypothetical protein
VNDIPPPACPQAPEESPREPGVVKLIAADLAVGSPTIGVPALGVVHNLDTPEETEVHRLTAEDLTVSPPKLFKPKPAAATPEEAKPTEAATDEKQTLANTESPPKRSRRRRQQNSPQAQRAEKVLRRLYPKKHSGDRWPTREEVADVDLVARAEAEYQRVEGQEIPKSRLGPPSPDTYLRVVGRRG